jgi:hypothetical protein
MILFMYAGDYAIYHAESDSEEDSTQPAAASEVGEPKLEEKSDPKPTNAAQDLVAHTAVYLLADEKDIPALKALAAQKYKENLADGWNSPSFCSTLKTIYEGTPDSDRVLWNAAVICAGSKLKELMDRGEFVELLKENGDIGIAIIKAHLALTNESLPPIAASTTPRGSCPKCSDSLYVRVGRAKKYWCQICRHPFD